MERGGSKATKQNRTPDGKKGESENGERCHGKAAAHEKQAKKIRAGPGGRALWGKTVGGTKPAKKKREARK